MPYTNLTDFCTAIANAIRTAEGSSGQINAQDFPRRIMEILIDNGLTLTYTFSNNEPSDASGTIYLVATADKYLDSYELYWRNANGIMTDYSPINTMDLTTSTVDTQLSYNKLITYNTIPKNATGICAVSKTDGRIKASYDFPQTKLWSATKFGERLYSFGAISDVHYRYDTGASDFATCMNYFENNENVVAVCCAGDLTSAGSAAELTEVKAKIDEYNTPFYSCNGNHEALASGFEQNWSIITDKGMYYEQIINGDVFLFVNIYTMSVGNTMFPTEELDWLETKLEQYRNRRVFLFQHVPPYIDYFANPNYTYGANIWGSRADRVRFLSLMEHYKNVIWFSGHTHMKYNLQEIDANCNVYQYNNASRWVHIASLTVPRDIQDGTGYDMYAQSEGAVVDVYTNYIIIRCRNFVDGKFIGLAQYLIDTTPVAIEANPNLVTYTVTNVLEHTTNSNADTVVNASASYTANISADSGYVIDSVTVTMNGVDVTSTYYSNGVINIPSGSINGNIVITATSIVDVSSIPCTAITLSDATHTFTNAGETKTLTATLTPANTTDTITWSSSNTSVATVNNGVVTSVANGSAIITVTCGSQSATCSITVSISTTPQADIDFSGTVQLSGVDNSLPDFTLESGYVGVMVYSKSSETRLLEFPSVSLAMSGGSVLPIAKQDYDGTTKAKIYKLNNNTWNVYTSINIDGTSTIGSFTGVLHSTRNVYTDSTLSTVSFNADITQ